MAISIFPKRRMAKQ